MAIIDKPSDYFNTVLYTGNGSSGHAITGVGFQPDFLWLKPRSTTGYHRVFDVVRGAGKQIYPNETNQENTDTNQMSAFNSDGFTLGNETGSNANGTTFVAWNWKAGTSFTNDASSTGIGTIDSTGSVNTDAGVSIVSFTGTGSNGTIKHGLSTKPSMVIIKRRDSANDWRVGSDGLTNWTKHVNLNTEAAQSDLASAFNSTAPTSSVFSVGTSISVNASGGTYIAYCFASINGYSKIGETYTGNGNANGPFIYTGFKPAFILLKNTERVINWEMLDNKRPSTGQNPADDILFPNTSDAESSSQTDRLVDFVSNGIKIRGTSLQMNASGQKFIYMAFAENPFVASNFNAATAR